MRQQEDARDDEADARDRQRAELSCPTEADVRQGHEEHRGGPRDLARYGLPPRSCGAFYRSFGGNNSFANCVTRFRSSLPVPSTGMFSTWR